MPYERRDEKMPEHVERPLAEAQLLLEILQCREHVRAARGLGAARGETGEGGSKAIPRFVEHPGPGMYGSKCGVDPEFADWTCDGEAGLQCVDTDGDELGTCLAADGRHTGDSCETAKVQPSASSLEDTATLSGKLACAGDGFCEVGNDAFPGGACMGACRADQRGQMVGDAAVCADVPFGAEFD